MSYASEVHVDNQIDALLEFPPNLIESTQPKTKTKTQKEKGN